MQVIIAIQAKMRLFSDDVVDIVLTDHSINADKRAEGLKKTGLFRRVKFIMTKAAYNHSSTQRIFDAARLMFADNMYSRMFWDDDFDYDRIIFYNTGPDIYTAFEKAVRFSGGKKIPELIRMEEGLFSCCRLHEPLLIKRMKPVHFLHDLMRKPDIFNHTRKFMCFYPELIDIPNDRKKDYTSIRLPKLTSDKEFLEAINTVFDYDPSSELFPQKYIYFAVAADLDGFTIGEEKIILRIAEIVGKDNLLVKVHPRDERDVFRQAGLNVSRNSALPWEVMQLNHDFSKHVFVSLYSGSPVNITAMKNENIPAFMLYPAINGKNPVLDGIIPSVDNVIHRLKSMGVCGSVKVTGRLEDVKSL